MYYQNVALVPLKTATLVPIDVLTIVPTTLEKRWKNLKKKPKKKPRVFLYKNFFSPAVRFRRIPE